MRLSTPTSSLLFSFSHYLHPRHLHSFPTRRSSDLRQRDEADLADRPDHPGRGAGDGVIAVASQPAVQRPQRQQDRKSTRLNSSHRCISYAVFCLKKKKKDEWKRTGTAVPPPLPRRS